MDYREEQEPTYLAYRSISLRAEWVRFSPSDFIEYEYQGQVLVQIHTCRLEEYDALFINQDEC